MTTVNCYYRPGAITSNPFPLIGKTPLHSALFFFLLLTVSFRQRVDASQVAERSCGSGTSRGSDSVQRPLCGDSGGTDCSIWSQLAQQHRSLLSGRSRSRSPVHPRRCHLVSAPREKPPLSVLTFFFLSRMVEGASGWVVNDITLSDPVFHPRSFLGSVTIDEVAVLGVE